MLFILSNEIGIVDVLALIISLFALFATLRKKEYGKFWFLEIKENSKSYIIIHLIKSDVYEVKIQFEPYANLNILTEIIQDDNDTSSLFANEPKPYNYISKLKEGSVLRFKQCKSSKIHITFRDKYNNSYSQKLTMDSISKRYHKNFWNLTFFGS